MSNPRPCKCGHAKNEHSPVMFASCYRCSCSSFVPAKRTEPLRANRGPTVPVSVLREFLDAEREHWASSPVSLAYYGGAITQLDRIRKRFCD